MAAPAPAAAAAKPRPRAMDTMPALDRERDLPVSLFKCPEYLPSVLDADVPEWTIHLETKGAEMRVQYMCPAFLAVYRGGVHRVMVLSGISSGCVYASSTVGYHLFQEAFAAHATAHLHPVKEPMVLLQHVDFDCQEVIQVLVRLRHLHMPLAQLMNHAMESARDVYKPLAGEGDVDDWEDPKAPYYYDEDTLFPVDESDVDRDNLSRREFVNFHGMMIMLINRFVENKIGTSFKSDESTVNVVMPSNCELVWTCRVVTN